MRELLTVEPPVERSLLVGAPRKGSSDERRVSLHLDELARLAETAGAEVGGSLIQAVERPHPKTYVGAGKVEELKAMAQDTSATLVLFDEELSPAQGAALEKLLDVRVMDRTELILDIFATHARSREAKMQVELAQLQYLLPRLKRMWTHLSRIRGGIGLRGPGETQLEVDRRMIGQRISRLKKRLREVARHRDTVQRGREGVLQVALVGYTNAGKSSILNALAGQPAALVEDQLFATLDPTAREVDLGAGYRARVVDTVGFIRKLPHHLVASFRGTLREAQEADILAHVVDASDPAIWEHVAVVERTLEDAGVLGKRLVSVINKIDLLGAPAELEEAASARLEDWVLATTMSADGVGALRDHLLEAARAERPEVKIKVPACDGALLASVYREGEVVAEATEDDAMVLTVRMSEASRARIVRMGGSVLTD